METSANYPNLIEPGLRRKKKNKRLERGEIGWYDKEKAGKADSAADKEYEKLIRKKAGVKWGKNHE